MSIKFVPDAFRSFLSIHSISLSLSLSLSLLMIIQNTNHRRSEIVPVLPFLSSKKMKKICRFGYIILIVIMVFLFFSKQNRH